MNAVHVADCKKKDVRGVPRRRCGGHFKCPHCKQWRGWCLGASDNMPEACDFCWKAPAEESEARQ